MTQALGPAVMADLAKTTTTIAITTTMIDGVSEITTKIAMLEDSDSLAHLLQQPGTEDVEASRSGLASPTTLPPGRWC